MSEIFFPVKATEIKAEILDVIYNGEEWVPYYNFMAKKIPDEVVQKDEFLAKVYEAEPFMAGITMMHPMTVYDWHVDSKRGATLNMLVDAGACLTMFTTPEANYVRPIRVAEYTPEYYHFFNTQVPHTVFNFDKPRYLFTVEFQKSREEFTPQDLVNLLAKLEEA